ncbi:DUF1127 domain-containing protein [Limibaculum sp. FT325]|uniref:DUF1127 domain-containing protein n=1 Tax=Thermohalobaculum sediminis TaxID=2939436 RepID=UPI0020BF238E|nr:DUF1127 domain-containing protein [Limibaculum sediminis]MCL5775777.1 DUF1127 domain-containing protein [Limibaculum sediminis]
MNALTLLFAPRAFRQARLPLPSIERWLTVAAERRRLAALPDHVLKDIGLSRADAMAEAARPFWDTDAR